MAATLSCPLPNNMNPLSSNGFNFSIVKLPKLSFFCQEVNLPEISLPEINIASPLSVIPITGEVVNFGELQLQFLIDENMANYKSVFNWIIGAGFPDNNDQYVNFLQTNDTIQTNTELAKSYSDGTLEILGSNNQAVQTITFVDMFPIALSSLTFQTTATDVQYLAGNVTLKYSRFYFS